MTRKRIIVEGPDGSGKSTLITNLLNAFPGLLEFRDGFLHSGEPDFATWITKELFPVITPKKIPIHNRFFYSELIYGPILRGKIALDPIQTKGIQTFLREEAFLIYCSLSYADLVKSATENPQMEGVLKNFRKIYHSYDDIMAEEMPYYWPQGRCTSFNYKRDSISKLLAEVGEYLEYK